MVCSQCGDTVAGEPAWTNFALECRFCSTDPKLLETDACALFQLHKERAIHESKQDPDRASLWLRGLTPWPGEEDQFDIDYTFQTTWQGRLNVQGAILAGDGSGGPHSSEPALRRCGFGLACIEPHADGHNFDYLGHSFGSVPGKQTVPRAEATAILQALRHTTGNAVFICDNWGWRRVSIKALGTDHLPMVYFGIKLTRLDCIDKPKGMVS